MDPVQPPVTGPAPPETLAVVEELARAYEELHLLHGLAGVLEDEMDHRLIFLKILACLKELLPIEKAEVWIPYREAKEFRSILLYDGTELIRSTHVIPCDLGVEGGLIGLRVRVLRDGQKAVQPVDFFLLQAASRIGLPVIVVPLLRKAKVLGLLVLRIPPTLQNVDSSRLRLVAAAARQMGVNLQLHFLIEELRANEGLRREIEIARQIQHDLLPQQIPQSDKYDLHGGCVTAARVGGDYYDFFSTPGENLGLLIADVAGHSVASALIAMSFRSSFRHFLEQRLELDLLFDKVNLTLHRELKETGSFLSAVYTTLDERTLRLRYVNAGHPHPLLRQRKTGSFRCLDQSSLLVGILPGIKYPVGEVALAKGDILILYTDGIVEAENQHGDPFGKERLEKAVERNNHKSAREIYYQLLKEMYLFQDERFNKDDVTLVVLKVKD
jgi:serine phosphatase RsbU (regulator of sigma subunit)